MENVKDGVKSFAFGTILVGVAIAIFVGIIWGLIWGWQYFKVFKAEQTGKAELAQAEQNRQISIIEAEAANTAATSQALAKIKIANAEGQAEVERAKGAAEANRIIADSLKNNEAYLRYLWIQELGDNQNVIYVPTEASLPILEARNK